MKTKILSFFYFCIGFTSLFNIQVNNAVIIITALFILVLNFRERKINLKDWITPTHRPITWFLLFYFFNLFSLLYSTELKNGITIVLEKWLLFLIFPVIFLLSNNFKNSKALLYGLLVGTLTFCLLLNFFVLADILISGKPFLSFLTFYTRWNLFQSSSFNMHAPYLGLFINFSIIFSYYLYKQSKDLLYAIFILYLILMLYLVSSQMPVFVFAILLFTEILSNLINTSKAKAATLCVGLVVVFGFLTNFYKTESLVILRNNLKLEELYWGSLPNRLVKLLEKGDEARTENWKSALSAIKERPVFGYGVGSEVSVLQGFRDKGSWAYQASANAHNQFLSILLSTGLVGLGLWITAYAFSFKNAQHSSVFFFFLVIFFLSMFSESLLARNKGILFFTEICFLSLTLNKDDLKRFSFNSFLEEK